MGEVEVTGSAGGSPGELSCKRNAASYSGKTFELDIVGSYFHLHLHHVILCNKELCVPTVKDNSNQLRKPSLRSQYKQPYLQTNKILRETLTRSDLDFRDDSGVVSDWYKSTFSASPESRHNYTC